MSPPGQAAGYMFVVGANMFWGLNFVIAKLMAGTVPPLALSFWRWATAALLLLPLLPKVWGQRRLIAANWRVFLMCAMTGVVLYHVCIYIGAHSSSSYSLPLIAAFSGVFVKVAYVVSGQGVSRVQFAGGLLAVVGLAILVARGELENLLGLSFVVGDLWMLFGALAWALYSIVLERLPAGRPFANHASVVLVGLPFLAVLYGVEAASVGPFEPTPTVLASLLYLAVFPSIVCYWFWMGAIARLGAVRTHALYYTLPLFAALEAWLVIGEDLHLYHAAAAVAIISGAVLTTHNPAVAKARQKARV